MCRQCMGVVHTIYVNFVSSFIYIHCNTFITVYMCVVQSSPFIHMDCNNVDTINMHVPLTLYTDCSNWFILSDLYVAYLPCMPVNLATYTYMQGVCACITHYIRVYIELLEWERMQAHHGRLCTHHHIL